jgi:hypothetical protein
MYRTAGLAFASVCLLSIELLSLTACSSSHGDPPAPGGSTPLGQGLRIRDIGNPASPTHPRDGAQVNVTGAALLWIDAFDETQDGKSRGTVFVQDVGSQAPYSGISIFAPAYIPADLRVAPGDVLDFAGQYKEMSSIGSAKFPANQFLIQLSKPVSTFRFEYRAPDPTVVPLTDLDDFDKGRQWSSMLVTVNDVAIVAAALDSSGKRVTYTLDTAANGVAISNELFDLKLDAFPVGTHFKSVTGVVTWFFSYHIAPRSKDDLVVAP